MEDEALVPPCDHGHGDVDVDDDTNYAAAAKKVDEARDAKKLEILEI